MRHPNHYVGAGGRGAHFVRQWRLLVLLRVRWCTLRYLARELGVTRRTVRRDLQVLQGAGLPIRKIDGISGPHSREIEHAESRWHCGKVPAWPVSEPTPVADLPSMQEAAL